MRIFQPWGWRNFHTWKPAHSEILYFWNAPACRKQQQIFKIRQVQINELPRTQNLCTKIKSTCWQAKPTCGFFLVTHMSKYFSPNLKKTKFFKTNSHTLFFWKLRLYSYTLTYLINVHARLTILDFFFHPARTYCMPAR